MCRTGEHCVRVQWVCTPILFLCCGGGRSPGLVRVTLWLFRCVTERHSIKPLRHQFQFAPFTDALGIFGPGHTGYFGRTFRTIYFPAGSTMVASSCERKRDGAATTTFHLFVTFPIVLIFEPFLSDDGMPGFVGLYRSHFLTGEGRER